MTSRHAGLGIFLGTAAAFGSCGSPDEATKVRDTVRAAIAAASSGSAHRACAYATPAGRARFVRAYGNVDDTATGRPSPVYRSCEAVVRHERVADRTALESIRRGKVSNIHVRGGTATVLVSDQHGDSGHMALRKLRGDWRIDDSDALSVGS